MIMDPTSQSISQPQLNVVLIRVTLGAGKAREMAQKLRKQSALPEVLSSIPMQPHDGSQTSVMESHDAFFWCV